MEKVAFIVLNLVSTQGDFIENEDDDNRVLNDGGLIWRGGTPSKRETSLMWSDLCLKKLLLCHGRSECEEQFNLGQITPVTIATYLDQRFKKIYFSPDNLLQVES